MTVDLDVLLLDAVDHYGLHDCGVPVDLSPLEEICPITYELIRPVGLLGFTFSSKPASVEYPADVVLCKSLPRNLRRIAYAHEAAHAILGFSGAMSLSDMDPWYADKQERDAWRGAAILLIPWTVQDEIEELTLDAIAHACDVPRFVAEQLPQWWWP